MTPFEYEGRAFKALQHLLDPIAFARDMREYTFSNDRLGYDSLFGETGIKAREPRINDEMLGLVREALGTPGANPHQAIDYLEDTMTNHASYCEDVGVHMGIAFERMRSAMVDAYVAMAAQAFGSHTVNDVNEKGLAAVREHLRNVRTQNVAKKIT